MGPNLIEIPTDGKRREVICTTLWEFGFEYRFAGTRYLSSMIEAVLKERRNIRPMELYAIVACQHASTVQNVEKCARWAIRHALKTHGDTIMKELRGCADALEERRLTLSDFVFDTAAYIMLMF